MLQPFVAVVDVTLPVQTTTVLGTTFSTTTGTQYSQTTVPPYTILGVVASAAILILLALILGYPFSLIEASSLCPAKGRKKRKR